MTEAEIYSELTDVMREVFDDDSLEIGPMTTAENVDGWDSQAHITLIVATEVRFGVRFRTAEVEGLKNVGELVRLIAAKQAAN
jgi:acyl carrier protein